MSSTRIKLVFTLVVSLISVRAWCSSNGESGAPGPIEAPAIRSSVATQAVMLSVARAGNRLVGVGERGFIIISDDNAGSWKQVDSPVSVTLVKVRFVDQTQGWAVGHSGVVLHTEDGGLSWTRQLTGLQGAQIERLAAQKAADANGGGVAEEERLAQAQQLVDDGPDKPLLDLLFFNARDGLVVGAYGLAFATHDGGLTWQSLRAEMPNPSGLHLYALARVGADVFAAGEQGILLKSADEGKTFQSITSPYEGTSFGLQPTPDGGLVLFGLRGNAYRSDDRGVNWRKLDTLQQATLTSSLADSDGSILLADEGGRVIKITPGSSQAKNLALPLSGYLTGMVMGANNRLIISSARGMLIASHEADADGDSK